ncbi:MAG: glycosyltransferase family 9 protein, partial [Bacteroidales bacterium]
MIKKILIIRFSSLGDTLLCTPIARCLKEKGGYEVHFLTKKASVPLLEGNPHIDHIHVFNDSLKECILDLQKEKFDFVVDLHKNLRSFCVRAALHKLWKQVGTYPKLSVARFARIHLHCKKAMPPTHVVDRYFKAIQSLGIQNDGKGLELFNLQKPISIEIPQLPFVAIAVGSKHFTKQIPLDRFIELCQNIHAPIVLLGDQTDANKAQAVLAHCPSVINACGKLSLAQTAYTIQAARLLISGDSALMHIAS